MDDNAQISQENEATLIVHDELSIILNASSFEPAHINPDFLRYNEIVGSDWRIDYPVVIETGLSSITYENGLTLTATMDSLTFSQTGAPLALSEITAPDIARRYLERSPWQVEYSAIYTKPERFDKCTRRRLSKEHFAVAPLGCASACSRYNAKRANTFIIQKRRQNDCDVVFGIGQR